MAARVETVAEDLRSTYNTGKTKSYEWRVSQVKAILKIVTHHEKDILEALYSDLNKPEQEAFIYEIAAIASACRLTLKELKKWMSPQKAKTTMNTFPSSAEIVPEPLGVVLIISPWNYPFLLSLEPLLGAVAAGNTVLLKPSEIAPASAAALRRLIGEYVDDSAVKVIEGGVPETTTLLEQKWDKIFYTGNGKVGRIIMAAAAKNLTPVVLELGGKSPAVIDPNTDLKVTAKRIVSGKWGCNSGQTCVSCDYLITTKASASKLVDALACEIKNFYGENPLKSNDLSRIVNSHHFDRLTRLLLEDGNVSDKVVVGGQMDKSKLKIAPSILLDVPEDSSIMNEEIFGPLLPIITVDRLEDSFDFINARDKPLAAYLFTNDKRLKEDFVRNVSSGGMAINDIAYHLAEPSLPFGGVGESGMGAYHGKYDFDAFTHKKSVLSRGFGGDISARYAPYSPAKLRFLKALMAGDIFGILRAWIVGTKDE